MTIRPWLFDPAPFVSHSGVRLPFKVDCDGFSDDDIAALAQIAAGGFQRRRIHFGVVHGVPRGGLRLAHAMTPYVTPASPGVLIVDDVMTTGASMEAARALHGAHNNGIGLVIVERFHTRCLPPWVYSIFTIPWWLDQKDGDAP